MQDLKAVRGAGANQITERPTDAKKVGGAKSDSGIFVKASGRIVNFWTNRINAIRHTPGCLEHYHGNDKKPRWIYANEINVNKEGARRKFLNLKFYSKCIFV